MGMAASQGRLLFMTARISNNEFEQQCVAYSKQRLADDSQQANDLYLEAMQATQYQILSGYNGDSPNYEPVTYNQITAMNAVATRKQYIVSDNKGQILVTSKIGDAFGDAHNDFNTFLKKVGNFTQVEKETVTSADVHDAWDKYFASVRRADSSGMYVEDESDHYLGFSFHETKPTDKNGNPIQNADSICYVSSKSAYIMGGTVSGVGKQNKIYLNENEDGTYSYTNYKIVAEALPDDAPIIKNYIDKNGEEQTLEIHYLAKYKPAHYDAEMQDMMDDEGYVYLDSNYCYAELDEKDNQIYFRWAGGEAKKDEEFDKYAKQKEIYVDQDFNRFDAAVNGTAGSMNHPYIVGEYTTTVNITTDENGKMIMDKNSKTPKTDENGNIIKDENGNIVYKPNFGNNHSVAITDESKPIFFEGSTKEQRDLYDYAMAVSEKYAKGSQLKYDADTVQYYKNIYQEMITKGFTTFDKMLDEKYINTITYDNDSATTVGVSDEKQAYMNENWLINQLKCGKLFMAYYDSTAQGFVNTTLDDDESIVQKENKKKMAIAEQVYQNHMDRIESEDKRFDMQLTKLESEHTALTTEYESVAKVISKNVEKSFNIFNA